MILLTSRSLQHLSPSQQNKANGERENKSRVNDENDTERGVSVAQEIKLQGGCQRNKGGRDQKQVRSVPGGGR